MRDVSRGAGDLADQADRSRFCINIYLGERNTSAFLKQALEIVET